MIVTAYDFQADVPKYLAMVAQEDIIIMQDGKPLAHIVKPNTPPVTAIRGLLKHAPHDTTAKSIRAERLANHEYNV